MDKEGKKTSSKEKSNSLPPKRGQIKAKIFEEWKETLRGGCKRASTIVFAPAAASGGASFSTQAVVSSFGIAFDIDGVILRGTTPIGNSRRALRRLYDDSESEGINMISCVLGGGIPESRRASELSDLLGVKILASQVVQGHSPFRTLLKRFENEFIVATGKGEPAVVMSEYGFKRVISLEAYASLFKNIDPVAQYKRWTTKQEFNCSRNSEKIASSHIDCSQKVKAAFVVSDPVDWGRDIQVLCDILTSGGVPGEENGQQPPLYFAADDLQYQAAFPSERLGMGAFRIALESVFNSIHDKPLEYTSFGKPNPFVFRNAEMILRHLLQSSCPGNVRTEHADVGLPSFKTLYMIGDNPLVDVKGAQQAGYPWFSILTRTGVFRQRENHTQYPADMVVDTVEEAVDFILKREDASS
ncbi:putative CDP-alcohol phosphatidyltransferase class-I family protein C22A12.08c [Sesamum alatum]|uniref:CDP-alcohol phosphatidyltransferase class-I family protein C22A12.08c n=1 Tax=Sesamum alatum TaxID=300844 RepID=A0AAE1YIJ7_9LAMI|nr:putative CDP-alcohol phosphatidyltransferase class-I family protein C22A12.08c [Sesamum alatum]